MIAYCDGLCWPNPGGPAAWGWMIEKDDGRLVAHDMGLIPPDGAVTNNVAEYVALIALLEYAAENGIGITEVRTDSRLVVNQVNGRWRARGHLRRLRDRVRELLTGTIVVWIPREANESADALTREAYDEWCREADAYAGAAP